MCLPFLAAVGQHKVHKAVTLCFCIYFIVLLGSCLLFHTCSSILRTYLKRANKQIPHDTDFRLNIHYVHVLPSIVIEMVL